MFKSTKGKHFKIPLPDKETAISKIKSWAELSMMFSSNGDENPNQTSRNLLSTLGFESSNERRNKAKKDYIPDLRI